MNHGREKGKRKKPVKKRREGYTGERAEKEKEYKKILKEKRAKSHSPFLRSLRKRLLSGR